MRCSGDFCIVGNFKIVDYEDIWHIRSSHAFQCRGLHMIDRLYGVTISSQIAISKLSERSTGGTGRWNIVFLGRNNISIPTIARF